VLRWLLELPKTFDVGIVGAGVAGSVCAEALGRAGVSVAIFDNSHPRDKPCGGLVENRLVEEFRVPETVLQNEIRFFLAERFGLKVKLRVDPPAFLVSRRDFDHYLFRKALEHESVVHFNERVARVSKIGRLWRLETCRGNNTEAKVIVGADGCPSVVRNSVCRPIPREFLATTVGYDFTCSRSYIEEAFPKNTVEAYFSRKYVRNGGFVWFFPKGDRVNVGIGSLDTGKKLAHALNTFIASHPSGKRLKSLSGRPYAHLVPAVWREQFFDSPCAGEDWAVLGDAAAHVNPINGAGIYYAMKDGVLCASAFLHGDLASYDELWRREYGDELYYGARMFLRYYGAAGPILWMQYLLSGLIFGVGLL